MLSMLQENLRKKKTNCSSPRPKQSRADNTNEGDSILRKHSMIEIHLRNQPHVTKTNVASLPNEEMLFTTHIFKDFILSWYSSISSHQQVPEELLTHLRYLFQMFKNHSKQFNINSTVHQIFSEVQKHVSQFRISTLKLKQLPLNSCSTIVDVYGHYFEIHQATQNQSFMEDYFREVVNLLLLFLLPSDIYRYSAGKSLLQEIIACNVFISLVDLLSDPDTLNDIIVWLTDPLTDDNLSSETIFHSSEQNYNIEKQISVEDFNLETKPIICKDVTIERKTRNKLPDDSEYTKDDDVLYNSSDSDDQKVFHTYSNVPTYLDFNGRKLQKSASVSALPNQQYFPSPPRPLLHHSKSSPILSQTEQLIVIDENTKNVHMTELGPSKLLKKVPSLTSLVSFQSIAPDNDDSELWFIDGEEDAQDGFVIAKDPGPVDDNLVLSNKQDAGFASDTFKMLHGMVDSALSKLPSIDVNSSDDCVESYDDGDGVFSNLMENLKSWKTSIEDELDDQFTNHTEPPSNDIVISEYNQSNWGHDFVKEQQKIFQTVFEVQQKDVTNHKKNVIKHSESLNTNLNTTYNSTLGDETAMQKRAMYSESKRKFKSTVLEDLPSLNLHKERSIWIQSMLIVDTETMKDERNITKDYTLYIIKYQALIWRGDEHPKEPETRLLKRRFREFTNLQSRLELNPHLKPLLKGMKDVPRKLQLVNRMNEDVVLQRKLSLERYLQNLCSISAICSSSEFQEFIAVEGDTHIEFVKKATEIVPRIDKFFLRGMSGIMGTLKSKLPSSTMLPENQALMNTDHEEHLNHLSRSMSEMPTSPFSGIEISRPQRSYAFRPRDSSVEKNIDVLVKGFLENRVTNSSTEEDKENVMEQYDTTTGRQAVFQLPENNKNELNYAEIPLADAFMCLLCEAMHDYGNWIVKETTQQIIAIAFGKLINKLLEDVVNELVNEGMCARYIQLIRQALWPNGQLISKRNTPKTDEEKEHSRQLAFQRVKEFMPGIVTYGVGEDELENCLLFVHASLQDPVLNRHLVFTLTELLIDALLPEVQDVNIREKLL
ncbi:uncharacterized protein [Antedon mediterranea]|uniref:uncharacterized protein n=1 Tax=Antedon mediterranea TaxID=105859 RepID=UPI003AF5F105